MLLHPRDDRRGEKLREFNWIIKISALLKGHSLRTAKGQIGRHHFEIDGAIFFANFFIGSPQMSEGQRLGFVQTRQAIEQVVKPVRQFGFAACRKALAETITVGGQGAFG